jgi:hypothetical protein
VNLSNPSSAKKCRPSGNAARSECLLWIRQRRRQMSQLGSIATEMGCPSHFGLPLISGQLRYNCRLGRHFASVPESDVGQHDSFKWCGARPRPDRRPAFHPLTDLPQADSFSVDARANSRSVGYAGLRIAQKQFARTPSTTRSELRVLAGARH